MNGSVGFIACLVFTNPMCSNISDYTYIFFNKANKTYDNICRGQIQHLYSIKFCDNRIIIQQNFLL